MRTIIAFYFFFFFNDTATTEIYTLSLHDALPIFATRQPISSLGWVRFYWARTKFSPLTPRRADLLLSFIPRRPLRRSEEHTSELQSQSNLVCRLLLEKKKQKRTPPIHAVHATTHT